jgi:hypothetical protein
MNSSWLRSTTTRCPGLAAAANSAERNSPTLAASSSPSGAMKMDWLSEASPYSVRRYPVCGVADAPNAGGSAEALAADGSPCGLPSRSVMTPTNTARGGKVSWSGT